MQETWVQSLCGEDPLEKEMATLSSILAWEISRTEEPSGLQSIGSQKVQTRLSNETTTTTDGIKDHRGYRSRDQRTGITVREWSSADSYFNLPLTCYFSPLWVRCSLRSVIINNNNKKAIYLFIQQRFIKISPGRLPYETHVVDNRRHSLKTKSLRSRTFQLVRQNHHP